MSAVTYRIERVWDFLNIPEDRIDECLFEFAVALGVARSGTALLNEVARQTPGAENVRFEAGPVFEWIDDGERHAHITVNVSGGS